LFGSSTGVDDPDKVYLEREWRLIGNVGFDLREVGRVILPEACATRFRRICSTT
jgi:hypothetical protein